MNEYKTKISVSLNGAGSLYYVKEDCDDVKKLFEHAFLASFQHGFSVCVMFKNASVYGREIELLTINPSNCATVEVFENK